MHLECPTPGDSTDETHSPFSLFLPSESESKREEEERERMKKVIFRSLTPIMLVVPVNFGERESEREREKEREREARRKSRNSRYNLWVNLGSHGNAFIERNPIVNRTKDTGNLPLVAGVLYVMCKRHTRTRKYQ